MKGDIGKFAAGVAYAAKGYNQDVVRLIGILENLVNAEIQVLEAEALKAKAEAYQICRLAMPIDIEGQGDYGPNSVLSKLR